MKDILDKILKTIGIVVLILVAGITLGIIVGLLVNSQRKSEGNSIAVNTPQVQQESARPSTEPEPASTPELETAEALHDLGVTFMRATISIGQNIIQLFVDETLVGMEMAYEMFLEIDDTSDVFLWLSINGYDAFSNWVEDLRAANQTYEQMDFGNVEENYLTIDDDLTSVLIYQVDILADIHHNLSEMINRFDTEDWEYFLMRFEDLLMMLRFVKTSEAWRLTE